MEQFFRLMDTNNDLQISTFEHDGQPIHEQLQAIQDTYLTLKKHYHTLQEHHQALLACPPLIQEQYLRTTPYRQTLYDYRQSLQAFRHLIQHVRQSRHPSFFPSSSQDTQHRHVPVDRPLNRTTLLLAVGNAQHADVLKQVLQQADAHRVFMAADWREVLCLMQNVHLDALILDDDLNPLPGDEMYHHLQGMQRSEALAAIILRDCFTPFRGAERAYALFIELGKPITGEVLLTALAQLLSKQSGSI